jgi:hypothetical protein
VDAEVGEMLLVSKQAVQKFDAKRLYLKTPNNVAGTEEYQVKI